MKITKLHWWLPKILCFIAACALWVYVMNEQNPQVENTYTVPVEVRNLDRSLVAVDLPEKVKIVVRMSRSEMINTRSDDIKAYVDLTRADAGDVKGVPIQVVLPSSDETVVSIDPKSVDIRVEPYAVKSLPVTVYFFGTPTESFTPSVQQVTPDTITIAGSRSLRPWYLSMWRTRRNPLPNLRRSMCLMHPDGQSKGCRLCRYRYSLR